MPVKLQNNGMARPFLKWAGGKGQLLEQISQYLPQGLQNGSIKRYVEPFIGGGAMFFYMVQQYQFEECYISDVNQDLILTYKTIQKNVDDLIASLLTIQDQYRILNPENRRIYYYQVREFFNQNLTRTTLNHSATIERAAQIIFLNRTCFNGLFRVNSQGEFNVPMGRYKNPRICDAENLKAVSQVLQKTQIHYGDFAESEAFVNQDTFVYFDPPYRPLNKTSNFTAYAGASFDDREQERLRNFFVTLHGKGAKLMLSNSDPKFENAEDDFFEQLYKGYTIHRIQAGRNINSKVLSRGKINEILVINYHK